MSASRHVTANGPTNCSPVSWW